jgi:hypothetical protein
LPVPWSHERCWWEIELSPVPRPLWSPRVLARNTHRPLSNLSHYCFLAGHSPEPEEPRRQGPAERGSSSGTPKLIQRALLRGTALLASLGLGRDLQPPGGLNRERAEPTPVPPTPAPTPCPTQPPSVPLIRLSPKTPDGHSQHTPGPLLLDLGIPSGQPSAKSPRREETHGEWL